jgi:hypothetical protein
VTSRRLGLVLIAVGLVGLIGTAWGFAARPGARSITWPWAPLGAKVVSRIASRTSRRCVSIVLVHSCEHLAAHEAQLVHQDKRGIEAVRRARAPLPGPGNPMWDSPEVPSGLLKPIRCGEIAHS